MMLPAIRSNAFRVACCLGLAAVTAITVLGLTGSSPESTPALHAFANGALRYQPNTAYGFGEKLTFDLGYKFITVGQATMQIGPQAVTVNDRPCYDIKFDVRTTSAFDKVFKVRDRYETYVDVDGIFPWRFEQTVREGNYSRDFAANIDQRANVAKTTEGSFKTPAFVHDILSAFYYTRAVDVRSLKKGQSFSVKNFYGKQAYDLRVRVLGREQVEVPAGTFNCVVVEPLVVEGGLFKSEGRIIVYLTDDDRKIPVKVSTKVAIGSIEGKLSSYSGTRGPIAAKQN
ncbi:MAG: DUF3108 domain-containing protein [Candidatus Kapaibacterium sp.]